MGHTIWVDVEGRADDDLPSDNSMMLRLDKQLDKLAAKLGVARLTTFYDYSELEDEFDEPPDGEGDADDEGASAGDAGSGGAWFDPAAALAAVRAIRQHLLRRPADLGFKPDAPRAHWPANLMEELEHVQGVLEDAAARNKRFRFMIVP
jgi:hypothetical protein